MTKIRSQKSKIPKMRSPKIPKNSKSQKSVPQKIQNPKNPLLYNPKSQKKTNPKKPLPKNPKNRPGLRRTQCRAHSSTPERMMVQTGWCNPNLPLLKGTPKKGINRKLIGVIVITSKNLQLVVITRN